jgi:hypothetical protein
VALVTYSSDGPVAVLTLTNPPANSYSHAAFNEKRTPSFRGE